VAAGNDSLFDKLLEAISTPDLAAVNNYSTNDLRCNNADALKKDLELKLKTESTSHWLELLEAAGVPCGPINNIEQVLNDPQIKARNMVVTAHDPVAGEVTMAGNPIKFDEFDDPVRRGTPPALDGDRDAILKFLEET
jgi:CoA:oxalate CoA-transferase